MRLPLPDRSERNLLECMSIVLSDGQSTKCQFGHRNHHVMKVSVDLPGGTQREMTIFNWFHHEFPEPGFCPARDEVSKGIQHARAWESEASDAVWEVLRGPEPGVVIDVGAHIGWYSMLAEAFGRECLAVEACTERLGLIEANAPAAVPCRAWIGPDTPALEGFGDVRVRLLKIDVDGSEAEAFRVFSPLLPQTDAVLLEVTPPDLSIAMELLTRGFEARAVERPGKVVIPLTPDPKDIVIYDMDGQENFLFVRP